MPAKGVPPEFQNLYLETRLDEDGDLVVELWYCDTDDKFIKLASDFVRLDKVYLRKETPDAS